MVFRALLFSYVYNIETCKILEVTFLTLHFCPMRDFSQVIGGGHGSIGPMVNTLVVHWMVGDRGGGSETAAVISVCGCITAFLTKYLCICCKTTWNGRCSRMPEVDNPLNSDPSPVT